MPITKTMAYKVGEQCFPTVADAQRYALTVLFDELKTPNPTGISSRDVADFSVANANEIISILCLDKASPTARKPRSDKGTKRVKEFTAVEVK